jgi:hypothetical protein
MATVTAYDIPADATDEQLTNHRVDRGHPPLKAVYAHCVDALCEQGQQQQRVDAVREIVEFTFRDMMGEDASKDPRNAMVERSTVMLRFAHEEDMHCEHCGGRRELAEGLRPSYERVSGYRPDFLLQMKRHGSVEQAMIHMQQENQRKLKLMEDFAESEKAATEAQKVKAPPATRAKANTDA